MMTRRHFIETARMIREGHAEAETTAERRWLSNFTDIMADIFAKDNPRFDEARFRKACNPYDTGGETC